jgi:hypothetical protein
VAIAPLSVHSSFAPLTRSTSAWAFRTGVTEHRLPKFRHFAVFDSYSPQAALSSSTAAAIAHFAPAHQARQHGKVLFWCVQYETMGITIS